MLAQRQAGHCPAAQGRGLGLQQLCRHRVAASRGWAPRAWGAAAAAPQQQQQPEAPLPPRILLPGLDDEIALTREPAGPGFIPDELAPTPWVRPPPRTFTEPSIRASGTLRPGPEWFPAWMRFRRREDNYVFWKDMLMRCSLDIPVAEKRWTVFSSVWWLVMEFKYFAVPPSLRYVWWLAWRAAMQRVYEAHKAVVLWQAKFDAAVAARAVQNGASGASSSSGSRGSTSTSGGTSSSGAGGAGSSTSSSSSGGATAERSSGTSGGTSSGGSEAAGPGFSRAMALRRLHWKNSLIGELLYLINIAKTGRVHMLPPPKRPLQRPTFFFLF